MTELVNRRGIRGSVSNRSGKRTKQSKKRVITIEDVREGLRDALGDAATTVVLKEILPQNLRRLSRKELGALRDGLRRFFGEAGTVLYDQIVGE